MARVKNIEAFCNFCNTVTKMEISGEPAPSEDENKRWAKCKKCKHKMLIDLKSEVKEKKVSLDGIENEECVTYSPDKTFDIGQSIYHQGWDDFGKIVSKKILSDGKSCINVEFQKSGAKNLIESFIQQPGNEVN
jgi:DNA-directed RNA polymerase subunit RPC12/RpoP